MNFITADTAYCLYPAATMEANISLITVCLEPQPNRDAITKYSLRGWRMTHDCHSGPFFVHEGLRWIGDRHTWIFKLPGLTVPVTRQSPAILTLPLCSWTITVSSALPTVRFHLWHNRPLPAILSDESHLNALLALLLRNATSSSPYAQVGFHPHDGDYQL